jgi:mannose-6-phosphate isomerase-like protein (cupin superfamily)
MDSTLQSQEAREQQTVQVGAGKDRSTEPYHLGPVDHLEFKVSAGDTGGAMCIFETLTTSTIGPPAHLHHEQDEWFYVLEGEYDFRVGDEEFHLRPGDSLLAPRKVPHVWACVTAEPGRMVIVCQPAGTMEAFFREIAAKIAQGATPEEFGRVYEDHGMQIVGPPLPVE